MDGFPLYRALPIADHLPPGSSWGVFGDHDDLGTLNWQTPQAVVDAARLIRRGVVFPLNWDLELPDPPLFARGAVKHTLIDLEPAGLDDRYDSFYPQASSQWDALSHVEHPAFGFYNGFPRAEIVSGGVRRLGIQHSARRGIAGRFVLLDIARHRAASSDRAWSRPADVEEVQAVLERQNVDLAAGDVLLLRFGWTERYRQLTPDARERLASNESAAGPGLFASEETAAWLWDSRVSAVAADCPALEATPFDESTEDGYLHYRLVALLGMAIGELFSLDQLAADCADDRVYDGFFTSAPLNKLGGTGSPANALAIK